MGALLQLGLGGLFGIVLFRSGASDFDAMARMFLFEDAHLFALAGATTLASGIGLFWLLRSKFGQGVRAGRRPVHAGSVPGGVLFGLGWGLSGSCPGTVLAQLGAGHVIAGATLAGVLAGNWLFERYARRFGAPNDSCN